jgi:hypothetical protein
MAGYSPKKDGAERINSFRSRGWISDEMACFLHLKYSLFSSFCRFWWLDMIRILYMWPIQLFEFEEIFSLRAIKSVS